MDSLSRRFDDGPSACPNKVDLPVPG
eukprot:COSAG05_NODE_13797_length_418_cov_0.545455_1_plen_25_part_10